MALFKKKSAIETEVAFKRDTLYKNISAMKSSYDKVKKLVQKVKIAEIFTTYSKKLEDIRSKVNTFLAKLKAYKDFDAKKVQDFSADASGGKMIISETGALELMNGFVTESTAIMNELKNAEASWKYDTKRAITAEVKKDQLVDKKEIVDLKEKFGLSGFFASGLGKTVKWIAIVGALGIGGLFVYKKIKGGALNSVIGNIKEKIG